MRTRSKLTPGALVAAVAVTAVVGAVSLGGGRDRGEGTARCAGPTAEVDFQAGADRELPLDIEYFATGNPPRSTRVRTRSWLAVEPAVVCPGVAQLAVRNRRESGEVHCEIWVNEKMVVTRTTRGNDECFVRVRLVAA